MLRMSVSESARTGRPATGLFHTLLTGNIRHRGASGRNGADAAPTGTLRLSVSNKAKPSASLVARPRLDEHTAFIAAIFAHMERGAQPAPAHHCATYHRPLPRGNGTPS